MERIKSIEEYIEESKKWAEYPWWCTLKKENRERFERLREYEIRNKND